jgi:hypothetical protein
MNKILDSYLPFLLRNLLQSFRVVCTKTFGVVDVNPLIIVHRFSLDVHLLTIESRIADFDLNYCK